MQALPTSVQLAYGQAVLAEKLSLMRNLLHGSSEVPSNMKVILVTTDVFQPLTSPLNAAAFENMPYMVVSDDVSQPLTSLLNESASCTPLVPHHDTPQNMSCVLVICDMSHAEMCPYVVVAAGWFESHSATAASLLLLVICADMLPLCCAQRVLVVAAAPPPFTGSKSRTPSRTGNPPVSERDVRHVHTEPPAPCEQNPYSLEPTQVLEAALLGCKKCGSRVHGEAKAAGFGAS